MHPAHPAWRGSRGRPHGPTARPCRAVARRAHRPCPAASSALVRRPIPQRSRDTPTMSLTSSPPAARLPCRPPMPTARPCQPPLPPARAHGQPLSAHSTAWPSSAQPVHHPAGWAGSWPFYGHDAGPRLPGPGFLAQHPLRAGGGRRDTAGIKQKRSLGRTARPSECYGSVWTGGGRVVTGGQPLV